MIALGEVILTTGSAIAATPPGLDHWLPGACGLLLVIALWGLYFRGSDHIVSRHASETGNPIHAARLAMNGQFLVVGGLIAIAVAIEKIVAHPHGAAEVVVVWLLFGGVTAYVAVQTWYLGVATGRVCRARLAGAAGLPLVALLLTLARVSPLAVIAVAAALVIGLTGVTAWSRRGSRAPH
jgi:low temperature requirement protein LtrA